MSSYRDGALTGVPALTVNRVGSGTAWYLATRLDAAATETLVRHLCTQAGVALQDQPGVETVRRYGAESSYLFVLNHTDGAVEVAATGTDLVSGLACAGTVKVGPGGVAVVREERGLRCWRGSGRPTSSSGSASGARCGSAT